MLLKLNFLRLLLLDASAVNTGTALWQLYRNEFNTEFDRPNARNVILLFTEGLPQDDVATPAKALRDSGVTVRNRPSWRDGPGVDLTILLKRD